ncbi:unnamed protein product [Eruca vesicaria subsp. sativa]|uniref:Uncharacterized protein n=1 Tax=Eruca vesicaria subsp. sativa TaxID=29727 RepID=A0ABC8L6H4_ERUVS|nr:unnamed protein product [Eruca vesicaria subsp. sativa]
MANVYISASNKTNGNAWSLLSDKGKRIAYDQKSKMKEAKEKKSEPKPPSSAARDNPKRARQEPGSGGFEDLNFTYKST